MNDLKIFNNSEFGQVRSVMIDDMPWFVGKDVAEALGYKNPNEAIQSHIDEEDKLNSKLNSKTLSSLGQRGGWLINESGLYSLVLSSKLPSAKKFKHWVTSEVLPEIRRTGSYGARKSSTVKSLDVYRLVKQTMRLMQKNGDTTAAMGKELARISEHYNVSIPELLNEATYDWSFTPLEDILDK